VVAEADRTLWPIRPTPAAAERYPAVEAGRRLTRHDRPPDGSDLDRPRTVLSAVDQTRQWEGQLMGSRDYVDEYLARRRRASSVSAKQRSAGLAGEPFHYATLFALGEIADLLTEMNEQIGSLRLMAEDAVEDGTPIFDLMAMSAAVAGITAITNRPGSAEAIREYGRQWAEELQRRDPVEVEVEADDDEAGDSRP
jgi:hypothetical protein